MLGLKPSSHDGGLAAVLGDEDVLTQRPVDLRRPGQVERALARTRRPGRRCGRSGRRRWRRIDRDTSTPPRSGGHADRGARPDRPERGGRSASASRGKAIGSRRPAPSRRAMTDCSSAASATVRAIGPLHAVEGLGQGAFLEGHHPGAGTVARRRRCNRRGCAGCRRDRTRWPAAPCRRPAPRRSRRRTRRRSGSDRTGCRSRRTGG